MNEWQVHARTKLIFRFDENKIIDYFRIHSQLYALSKMETWIFVDFNGSCENSRKTQQSKKFENFNGFFKNSKILAVLENSKILAVKANSNL